MQLSHLNHFRKIFESKIQPVTTFSSEAIEAGFNEPGDVLDRVSIQQEQALSHSLHSRKVASVQSINAALQRIRMGSFGICEDCGDDIDLNRLEINPITTTCIQCQEERERYSTLRSAG